MSDADLDAGKCLSAPCVLPSAGEKKPYFHIMNPAESGKKIYVERIEGCANAAGYWTLRSYESQLSGNVTVCNAKFGAGAGVAKVTQQNISALIGNPHAEYMRAARDPVVIEFPSRSAILLVPGKGLLLCCHAENVEATCTFDWREEDE